MSRRLKSALKLVRYALTRHPMPKGDFVAIHLGCGPIDWPGFINVDALPFRHVHRLGRIDRLARIRSGTADFVYCSHALEHISHAKTADVLTEWHRILKPGGRLCLSVPDFDVMVEMYRHSNQRMESILGPLFGGQDYEFNFHCTAFNDESLRRQLDAAGFASVRRWSPGEDHWHSLPDWSGRSLRVDDREFPISLNLEAQK